MLAILKGETAETGIPLDRERKNTKQTQSRTTHRQSMGYDGFEYGAPAQRVGLTETCVFFWLRGPKGNHDGAGWTLRFPARVESNHSSAK